MGAWGNLIFQSAPFLVGSLVDTAGYTEQHAGWIFSGDMAGLALGSIITYLFVNRLDRRYIAATGILILIAGNILALSYHELGVLFPIRVLAGSGSGVLYAISIANLSGTHKTARNFSILLFLILVEGAIEALILPVFSNLAGVNGIFLFFIAAGILALPFTFWLCPHAVEKPLVGRAIDVTKDTEAILLPRYLPVLYLASIVVFTVVIGAVWTYLERAGISIGMAQATVSKILSTVLLLGIVGAVIAAPLSKRFGQGKMLLASLFGVFLVFTFMAANLAPETYVAGLVLFNILWVLVNVYQMGTLAYLDHTGRYGTLVPAAQDVAVSGGSPIAGAILAMGLGYAGVLLFGAVCSLLSFCVFLPAYFRVRSLAPDIADAP